MFLIRTLCNTLVTAPMIDVLDDIMYLSSINKDELSSTHENSSRETKTATIRGSGIYLEG